MTFMEELDGSGPLHGIGQGTRSLGRRLLLTVLVAAAAFFIKRRAALLMAGKTGRTAGMTRECHLSGAFLEGEKPGVATVAFQALRMAFMGEGNSLFPLAEVGNSLRRRDLGMASAAIVPGKRLFAVMTCKTVFGFAVIGYGQTVGALLDFEKSWMAYGAS